MLLTDLGSQIFDLDHAFRITNIAVKLQELFRDHREWAALDADDGLVQIRIDPCDGFGNEPLWELLFWLHRDDADAAVIFLPSGERWYAWYRWKGSAGGWISPRRSSTS